MGLNFPVDEVERVAQAQPPRFRLCDSSSVVRQAEGVLLALALFAD